MKNLAKETAKLMKEIIIRFNAGHDCNGNPRRVYAVIDVKSGDIIRGIDEGYRGEGAIDLAMPGFRQRPSFQGYSIPTIATTPAQYREICRIGGKGD